MVCLSRKSHHLHFATQIAKMKSPLQILHLEDDPTDTELVQRTLKSGGIDCVMARVQSRDEFEAALERGGFDLVLSDYSLPGFDGFSAAEMVQARCPALPLILVSGTLGEEVAVDSLKSGATDFVSKERLVRLVPSVRRAMKEVEERAEYRSLEAQMVEAQKMEVVGQLAAGVAHDFNNILAVIMGYSDILMQKLDFDENLRRYAGEIRLASERAAGLTGQLLVFSRKETVQLVVLDLNVVMQDMEKMLRRLIDENIEMLIAPGSSIGRVKADAGHLGQLIMNMAVNARDAMPAGGRLTISTANVTLDENAATAQPPNAAPGDYVRLSFSDTGTGITDEVKARMFEPLFTTKPLGKGTGLGLATCQAIVQNCGGCISVTSELGKGTIFDIYFPRVEQALEVAPAAELQPAGPPPRGRETLLIVEDDAAVNQLACDVLEAQGYEVLAAANGKDALQVASAHQGSPIRLVVTDVIMPKMGGMMMAEWLKVTHPGLKILFTSGYTDGALADQGLTEAAFEFLPKPYTAAILARRVRDMLDSAA